jgi:hypothetical protein
VFLKIGAQMRKSTDFRSKNISNKQKQYWFPNTKCMNLDYNMGAPNLWSSGAQLVPIPQKDILVLKDAIQSLAAR